MDDSFRVDVGKRLQHLMHVRATLLFLYFFVLGGLNAQTAALGKAPWKENNVVVDEVFIDFQDVWVVQLLHYFDFVFKLLDICKLFFVPSLDHFDCSSMSCPFVGRE